MKIIKVLVCLAILSLCSLGYAVEIKIKGANNEILGETSTILPFDIVNELIGPEKVKSYIPYSATDGALSFSLAAKKRSKVYLSWDNEDDLFLDYTDSNELIFRRPGQIMSVRFNVFKPVSGKIYVRNENKQLIKTIDYEVLRENSVRQSLRFSLNDSNYQIESTTIAGQMQDNRTGTYSVDYSITEKSEFIGDPYWSFNTMYRTSRENMNNQSVSLSASYSW